jgi:uncharacterized protein
MNSKMIEFSVGNYKSFLQTNTLSLVSTKIKSQDKDVDINNTIDLNPRTTLLKGAAIYGANASGKSNFITAMVFFKRFALNLNDRIKPGDPIPVDNFKLNSSGELLPSFFQMIFVFDGIQYRYGFEVTHEKVISEWLYYLPSQKEALLFLRDENGIKISRKFQEGKNLEQKTRDNVSFLSVVANFNGEISNKIVQWFKSFQVISGLDDSSYKGFTIKNFNNEKFHDEIVKLLKNFDLSIEDIKVKKNPIGESSISMPEDIPPIVRAKIISDFEIEQTQIQTLHKKYDSDGNESGWISFNLKNNESNGTQKLFFLSAPLIDTIKNGKILVIDEVEARLHPMITKSIIKLFTSKETNPNNAQLIISTHDTNLLSKKIFRRDQIWFVEKNTKGESSLYSLAELKVRNFDSFEDDYIKGRFGAIPFLSGISILECE